MSEKDALKIDYNSIYFVKELLHKKDEDYRYFKVFFKDGSSKVIRCHIKTADYQKLTGFINITNEKEDKDKKKVRKFLKVFSILTVIFIVCSATVVYLDKNEIFNFVRLKSVEGRNHVKSSVTIGKDDFYYFNKEIEEDVEKYHRQQVIYTFDKGIYTSKDDDISARNIRRNDSYEKILENYDVAREYMTEIGIEDDFKICRFYRTDMGCIDYIMHHSYVDHFTIKDEEYVKDEEELKSMLDDTRIESLIIEQNISYGGEGERVFVCIKKEEAWNDEELAQLCQDIKKYGRRLGLILQDRQIKIYAYSDAEDKREYTNESLQTEDMQQGDDASKEKASVSVKQNSNNGSWPRRGQLRENLVIDPERYTNELQYAEDAVGVDFETIEDAQDYYLNR